MGATAIPLHVDLGDVDQIRAAFKHVADEFGRLDASAHIGGYSWRGETLDVTEDLWNRVMKLNLRGPFFCCSETLPIMFPQGSGAITTTSAAAPFNPIYGLDRNNLLSGKSLLSLFYHVIS